jgi:peptidoglycan/xylan/chitin deacetylase (PgdA/CDA1 family)
MKHLKPKLFKKTSKKPKKYPGEKMHFVRATALVIIALVFIVSAGLSVYTFAKTREIVTHADIYRKQREYTCSNETDNRELLTTGSSQTLTLDPKFLDGLDSKWSGELNINADFRTSNVNEPELPEGYRNSIVGDISASFMHDKLNNTLHTFANITGEVDAQAGWYMSYINTEPGMIYRFKTTYVLDKARAVIVAEEVDTEGNRRYTDLEFLTPTTDQSTKTIVFLPKTSVKQLRFFTQLTSFGSMNIYQESVRSFDQFELSNPLISVSFDDGWEEVYTTAKPLLDEFNIKTTQGIIAESFRSLLAGYMDLGQVKHLANQGHEIASHSLRHCNLAQLSNSNLDYDIKASMLILNSEFKGVRGLAYPYGSYNEDVEAAAVKAYDYIRTTQTGLDSLLMNRYRLRGITVTPDMTFEDFKAKVDFAVENRLWINLIYHRIGDDSGEYGISEQMLRRQLEYIKSTPSKIVTASEAVDAILRQQRETFDGIDIPD